MHAEDPEHELILPEVIVAPSIQCPWVTSLAEMPGPPLPTHLASGTALPSSVFNPFAAKAPRQTFTNAAREAARSAAAMLHIAREEKLLIIDLDHVSHDTDLDAEMARGDCVGFCIHTKRDVILCGLNRTACEGTFRSASRDRGQEWVIDDAPKMVPLVARMAEKKSKTFKVTDDFTTRFGYSTNQLGPLSVKDQPLTLSRTMARGGCASVHFKNVEIGPTEPSICGSRAELRGTIVADAERRSKFFREVWQKQCRPRVTTAFQRACTWVRAPFVVEESLPTTRDIHQVRLAEWESALRAIEEHLMLSIFGLVPNVTWARILGRVLHRAEHEMGPFDVQHYRQWSAASRLWSHGSSPGMLGCPFKGCGSRILPKGACGISPFKPMHDDRNGMISLSCWTSMDEPQTATSLVFVLNGHEVSLRVSYLRWVLFMGYIPHETRACPGAATRYPPTARLHHSSFVKPDVEHLAVHVLSRLPCSATGGNWHLSATNRLRPDALSNMRAIQSVRSNAADVGSGQPPVARYGGEDDEVIRYTPLLPATCKAIAASHRLSEQVHAVMLFSDSTHEAWEFAQARQHISKRDLLHLRASSHGVRHALGEVHEDAASCQRLYDALSSLRTKVLDSYGAMTLSIQVSAQLADHHADHTPPPPTDEASHWVAGFPGRPLDPQEGGPRCRAMDRWCDDRPTTRDRAGDAP